ncbi:synaptotagmin-7 [Folsomia candida]|uniref:synaptotagmin-7 n=1 Tax=Folsomia candida TaxID=158441 RepID=UPI001604ECC4|nr:synaptotagmin-7 [Folsomia candida]XP_035712818.1 synaptotagmin-7 [Folsomia candida]
MVASAVLGAAAGTGLALVVALTIILYHYYYKRKNKDWGDLDRFESPRPSKYSTPLVGPGGVKPSRACIAASESGFGKCPYGTRDSRQSSRSSWSKSSIGSSTGSTSDYGHGHGAEKVKKWDSRGSRSSTKSCPPLYTYPQQEFHVDQEQRIVQPLDGPFASLPEVREVSSSDLSSFEQDGDYFTEHEVMLTHQSRSLPPAHPIPGQRLNRTPSISSQGSQLDYAVLKGHRGSSPAIRTFTPEGLSTGVSPPDSPPLVYHGSRSPSPITNIRATSLDMKGGSTSSNSSTVDLRISPLYDRTSSQSQNSLNSLSDRTNIPMCGVGLRRSSRCLSPLLIPPRSPTASDGSGQSPAPLSPLLGTLQLELYQKKDVKITLPGSKQPEANLDDGSKRLGQLRFQLKYDFDKSDLHVHVIEAVGLAVSNEGGFNDPYIRLYLSPGVDSRKRETSMHRNESSPYFDEHFKFPVSQEDLQDQILILQVFDYDRYSRNDVVGQVSFRLDEFDVTTALEINADVIKNKKPSGERQEILVSLSFLPHAERLGVVLLKARNLFLPPNKETLDPVVKVYLVGGGKRLKKKKTTPRRNTQDPVWNESVAFSISAASLANASLEICVLDQYSDLRGNTKAQVGRCILGPRENGSELAHWQDMRKNKNGKGVAMWHVLT